MCPQNQLSLLFATSFLTSYVQMGHIRRSRTRRERERETGKRYRTCCRMWFRLTTYPLLHWLLAPQNLLRIGGDIYWLPGDISDCRMDIIIIMKNMYKENTREWKVNVVDIWFPLEIYIERRCLSLDILNWLPECSSPRNNCKTGCSSNLHLQSGRRSSRG